MKLHNLRDGINCYYAFKFISTNVQLSLHVTRVIKTLTDLFLSYNLEWTSHLMWHNEWPVWGHCWQQQTQIMRKSEKCMHRLNVKPSRESTSHEHGECTASDRCCTTTEYGKESYLWKAYHLEGWDFKTSSVYGVQDFPSQTYRHINKRGVQCLNNICNMIL